MSDAQPPAGWFPDPEDPANLRYWDGSAWTDHRHPAEPAAPAAAPAAASATPQFAYQPTYGAQPTQGAQPGYVAPYGAAPGYGAPQNVAALVGMILSIAGAAISLLSVFFILLPIAGGVVSIFGLTRANSMRAAGSPNDRRTFALAGLFVGFGGALLSILINVGLFVFLYRPYSY